MLVLLGRQVCQHLPRELRQQILMQALRTADQSDQAMITDIIKHENCWFWGDLHCPCSRTKHIMLAYLSRAKLLSIELKGQIRPPVAHLKLLSFSIISALMVYPDVHDLTRNLIAAKPSINVDMAWVIERWARELDGQVLQGRRDILR